MSAILNSLNAHNFLNSQPILITLVSKSMVDRALPDKTRPATIFWSKSLRFLKM